MKSFTPHDWQRWSDELGYSPATEAGGFVFVSGCTGARLDDTVSNDPEKQFRDTFDNVSSVLTEAGVGFGDVVEMTTYHVGLTQHIDLFMKIKREYFVDSRPAWTAIGVSELYDGDAIVEIKVTAWRNSIQDGTT